jgi:hypothetical protein
MRLVEIMKGWAFYWEGSAKTRQLISTRLSVCDGCPEKQVISAFGQLLLHNEASASYKCRKCTCFLDPKAANPASRCPLNKWPDVPSTYG